MDSLPLHRLDIAELFDHASHMRSARSVLRVGVHDQTCIEQHLPELVRRRDVLQRRPLPLGLLRLFLFDQFHNPLAFCFVIRARQKLAKALQIFGSAGGPMITVRCHRILHCPQKVVICDPVRSTDPGV